MTLTSTAPLATPSERVAALDLVYDAVDALESGLRRQGIDLALSDVDEAFGAFKRVLLTARAEAEEDERLDAVEGEIERAEAADEEGWA